MQSPRSATYTERSTTVAPRARHRLFDRVSTATSRSSFCHDERSGLRAIIAIHSTALGPALGGTRFHPYASEADALRDVLNLSRGMSYKAAMAGLDLGGGKAVIIGDPRPTRPRRCCAPTAASCSP